MTPGYLDAIGMTLKRGRWIEAGDVMRAPFVAVVSETFLRQDSPDEDPLSRRFEVMANFGYGTGTGLRTIVRAVGEVQRGPTVSPIGDLCYLHAQFGPANMTIRMRSTGVDPTLARVQEEVAALDPGIPVQRFETVAQAMGRAMAPTRFYLLMVAASALVPLVLCGVVAFLMAQRTQEIDVRMALGARRQQVVALALGQGLRPTVMGLALGVALALTLGRVARSLLFEVSPTDPLVLAAMVGVLLVVAVLGSFLPARRASLVDPVSALPAE